MSKNLISPRKVNGKIVAWRVDYTNPIKGAKPRRIRYGHYETKEQAYEVAEQDYLNRRIRGRCYLSEQKVRGQVRSFQQYEFRG